MTIPQYKAVSCILRFTFSVVMLLVDLIYAYVDPRIKAQYEGQSKKRSKKEGKANG